MNTSLRADGRSHNQIRALAAEQGILNRADGSVRFVQGNTSVLVAVYGPAQPQGARKEVFDRAAIEVTWRSEKGAPTAGDSERELFIRKTVEEAVIVTHYPRCLVSVVIQVLSDDGSVLSAATNGVALALINAGIDMIGLPASTTCAISPNNGTILLDPTLIEEESALATTCITTISTRKGILCSKTIGKLTSDEYFACAEASARGNAAVQAFARMSIELLVKREAEVLR